MIRYAVDGPVATITLHRPEVANAQNSQLLDELADAARAMAEQVALVPPVTAQAIKESINRMLDLAGQRDSWRYHFMIHQFVSNTATALAASDARSKGGMDAVKREQAGR